MFATLALVASALLQVAPATSANPLDCARELPKQLASGLGPRPLAGARVAPLTAFYVERQYEPLFVDCAGPRPLAFSLVVALGNSAAEGLSTGPYAPVRLDALLARPDLSPRALARLELRLARVALLHASHRLHGRVDPKSLSRLWSLGPPRGEPVDVLRALASGTAVQEALAALDPPHEGFWRLRRTLSDYRAIQARGGWPQVPKGRALVPGDKGPRVRALRERLAATGELSAAGSAGMRLYDDELREAVRAFQRRHGLEADGVAGGATLAALRVPVEARIEQLLVNLERWRWVPAELGARRIEVNLPAYELRAVSGAQTLMRMRVVIGQPRRPSPLLTDQLTGLVLNPTWHLPRRIATEKLLEHAPKDPGWVRRHGYELWTDKGRLDPAAVDWKSLEGQRLPFSVLQRPGPGNALGQLRFELTNRLNVLLHATPDRKYFSKQQRALSNGCVRVEQPLWLGEFALGEQHGTAELLQEAMASRKTLVVEFEQPVPVHLHYWTAEVDDEGQVHFLADPYQLDRTLARRLEKLDRGWAR